MPSPSCSVHLRPARTLLSLVLGIQPLAQAGANDLEAVIPIEVLPVEASLATGKLAGKIRWSDPMVALQPARIARGIVLETGGKGILALAVLGPPQRDSQGRLRLDVPSHQQAWCDFALPVSHCLQDVDGDGKLEAMRAGILTAANPLTLHRVEASAAIDPIPYRVAREDELLEYHIGYASCAAETNDGADPQYRFTTAVRSASGGSFWSPLVSCSEVAKPLGQRDGQDPVYQFGRFKVAVGGQKDALETRLIEGIPAGALLGHLTTDQPLLDAVDAAATVAEKLDNKPVLYMSSPPEITERVAKGESLLRAQVTHGVTGKLISPLKRSGWTGASTWPIGTPVFGVAMNDGSQHPQTAPAIIWCIPGRDAKGRWDTQCVLPVFPDATLVQAPTPFAVTYLSSGSFSSHILPATVERGPADFGGPLHLTIRYAGSGRRYMTLHWGVGLEDEPTTDRLRLRVANDGSSHLFVAGMLIKIQPAADGETAGITALSREYRVDIDALPQDAYEMLDKK